MPGSKNTEIWNLKSCFFYLVNIGLAVLWYILQYWRKVSCKFWKFSFKHLHLSSQKMYGLAEGLILATVGWVCIRSTVMCVNASVLFTGLCVCWALVSCLCACISVSTVYTRSPAKSCSCSACARSTTVCLSSWTRPPSTCWRLQSRTSHGGEFALQRSYHTDACRLRPDVCNRPWGIEGWGLLKGKLSAFEVGRAQWLEHWTCDWKVTGSNPCRSDGRILCSRVNFLCRLLFWYPYHPHVTAVAHKRSRSFWQVTAKQACTLWVWLCVKWHDAWLYGVHRTRWDGISFMWHQPCQHCNIQKHAIRS